MPFKPELAEFGNGRVIGTVYNDPEYPTRTAEEQAVRMGRAVGCPVVRELIRPESGRGGAEGMRDRYLRVGFWFGQMVQATEWVNPALAGELKKEVPRHPAEPAGKYEPESVPDYYEDVIPPTETLTGYALPRLLIKLHDSATLSAIDPTERHLAVWGLAEDSAARAATPAELLAHCAQGAVAQGMEAEEVLKTVLPAGWYAEHNALGMEMEAKMAIAEYAPDVWSEYDDHNNADLDKMGVL